MRRVITKTCQVLDFREAVPCLVIGSPAVQGSTLRVIRIVRAAFAAGMKTPKALVHTTAKPEMARWVHRDDHTDILRACAHTEQ